MDIYLVRHGQTDGNVAKRHQPTHIGLNETGRQQAQQVAKLLRKVKPTQLISSTNKRALETAKYIGLEANLIPETYPAFEELRRPDFLIGKRFFEHETLKYVWGWFFGLADASMHDGESYEDFRRRLIESKNYLTQLPESSRVVIVSHAVFINFFLEHLYREEHMGLRRAFRRLISVFRLKNTAIIHLQYSKNKWHIKGYY